MVAYRSAKTQIPLKVRFNLNILGRKDHLRHHTFHVQCTQSLVTGKKVRY